MKKIMTIVLTILSLNTAMYAQDDTNSKYIRNSLYMIRLDMPLEETSDKESMAALNAGIDNINWEERYKQYNSVALSTKNIDWSNLPEVTQEEKDAVKKESAISKALNDQIASSLTEAGIKTSNITEGEYGAKLLKYFQQNKFGNQLVAKWHVTPNAPTIDIKEWDPNFIMIADYGLKGLSEEAKAAARASDNLLTESAGIDAENKLLNNTYICVNRFGYMSAQEVVAIATAPIKAKLASAPGLAQALLQKGIDKVIEKTKGYFICCNSYLFKLDWNDGAMEFNDKYYKNPAAFNDANYTISYVGNTSKRINCLTFKKGKEQEELMKAAALKGSDKCIAALQKEYDQFKPMSSLHEVDGKLVAYIGTKEGITDKSQFDVYSAEQNANGLTNWKKVGSLKVEKGSVWDNAEKIEGEGNSEEEEDAAEAGNSTIQYTIFAGKPNKKIFEGCMVKLVK